MKKIWFICCFSLYLSAGAQVDSTGTHPYGDGEDTLALKRVDVSIIRLFPFDQGTKKVIAELNPSSTMAQQLQRFSGVYIRTSGISSLSTPSYKGLGSMHTPIVVEGINLQSSMNGTMDLSLLDAIHFDATRIAPSSGTTPQGVNMGESINLRQYNSDPMLKLVLSTSSLFNGDVGGRYTNTTENLHYSLSAAYHRMQNLIPIEHYGYDGHQTNTNAERASVMQRIELEKNKVNWKNTVFLIGSDRSIPSSLLATSDGEQVDLNMAMGNTLTLKRAKGNFELTNQIKQERIDFDSELRDIHSSSVVRNVLTSVDYGHRFQRFSGRYGLLHQLANYHAVDLRGPVEWNRFRAYYDISYRFNRHAIRVQHQVENFREAYLQALQVYHFWNRYTEKSAFHVKTALSKTYRIPTFNELFWYEPGYALGNIDLEPESGYKLDVLFRLRRKKYQIEVNPYAGWFEQLIAWQGFPVIEAQNIDRVMVYGANFTFNTSYTLGKTELLLNSNLNLVRSVYRPVDTTDATFNKQLIYTPAITGNVTISAVRGASSFYVNNQLVGRNYFTSDNTRNLDPYLLVECGYQYQIASWKVGGVLANATNAPYFNIPQMPQPGIHLNINLTYQIKVKSWKEKP